MSCWDEKIFACSCRDLMPPPAKVPRRDAGDGAGSSRPYVHGRHEEGEEEDGFVGPSLPPGEDEDQDGGPRPAVLGDDDDEEEDAVEDASLNEFIPVSHEVGGVAAPSAAGTSPEPDPLLPPTQPRWPSRPTRAASAPSASTPRAPDLLLGRWTTPARCTTSAG